VSDIHAPVGAYGAEPQECVSLLFATIYALAYFGLWMALLTPLIRIP
jgi:hypothetical protein